MSANGQNCPSLLSSSVFPNRSSVYLREISGVLSVSVRQVYRWLETGQIIGVRVSCGSSRSHIRVPVSEYDKLVLQGGTQSKNLTGHAKAAGAAHHVKAHVASVAGKAK